MSDPLSSALQAFIASFDQRLHEEIEQIVQERIQAILDNMDIGSRAILAESLPAPSVQYRGQSYQIVSESGRADEIYQCMKLGNDTFDWVQIR